MNHAVIVVLLGLAFTSPSKPQDHSNATAKKSDASPQYPVTFVDNSSHTTQTDHAPEKATKAETPTEWANWALVGVGLLTFYAVWIQTKETAKATQAMRDSIPLQKSAADAALLNAQAVISSERAWVMANLRFQPGHSIALMSRPEAPQKTRACVELSLTNSGPTPAWVFEQWIRRSIFHHFDVGYAVSIS